MSQTVTDCHVSALMVVGLDSVRATVLRLVLLLPPWSAGSKHPDAWERSA